MSANVPFEALGIPVSPGRGRLVQRFVLEHGRRVGVLGEVDDEMRIWCRLATAEVYDELPIGERGLRCDSLSVAVGGSVGFGICRKGDRSERGLYRFDFERLRMEPVALRRRESEEESVWLTEVLQVSEDGALLYVVEGRMLRRPTVSTSARYTVLRVHVGTGQVEEITRLRAIHA